MTGDTQTQDPREPLDPDAALPVGWHRVGPLLRVRYTPDSYQAGAALVAAIAAAADAQDHHPDITLSYGDVIVSTLSHDVGTATSRDLRLARAVADLTREARVLTAPRAPGQMTIGLDTADAGRILPFWRAVYGLPPLETGDPAATDPMPAVVDPTGQLPVLWFQPSEVREGRNRFHLDVYPGMSAIRERLDAALAAGGTLVTDRFAPAWWVLADADGNEVCLCSSQAAPEEHPLADAVAEGSVPAAAVSEA
ncbi:VOC family protein [Brevibacterium litoralis]|uniref:VOC family protein n=1 Tax=Brevibacterium litoralis TaxID=3138935 RepID=UPI0032EC1FD3